MVPYIKPLREMGVGESDLKNIEVVGEPPPELESLHVQVPGGFAGKIVPGWLIRPIGRFIWVHPCFTDRCVKCGRCIVACPAGALSKGETGRPLLAPAKCIECCCCHEVCPARAVQMVQSPLLRFVRGGKA